MRYFTCSGCKFNLVMTHHRMTTAYYEATFAGIFIMDRAYYNGGSCVHPNTPHWIRFHHCTECYRWNHPQDERFNYAKPYEKEPTC